MTPATSPTRRSARSLRRKKRTRRAAGPTARTADRYALYESAVYDPDADLRFLRRVHRKERGAFPLRLREDFAGTSKLSAMWVAKTPEAEAWAVDLDPEPLAWGRERHLEPLGPAAKRVHQIQANVLEVKTPKVDVTTAFNFSYWVFQERRTMLDYFRAVHRYLKPSGMFALDLMGGPGAQSECEEEREEDGFTYVWEQEALDAITNHMRCHIGFRFRDGSRLRRAFTYDWRLWSLPELRDVLMDAGFAQVDAYWEGTDEDGEGNGIFRKRKHAENEETWIAYLVAWKRPTG